MLEIVFIIRGILNSWARPSTKTTKIRSPRIKSISQYTIRDTKDKIIKSFSVYKMQKHLSIMRIFIEAEKYINNYYFL